MGVGWLCATLFHHTLLEITTNHSVNEEITDFKVKRKQTLKGVRVRKTVFHGRGCPCHPATNPTRFTHSAPTIPLPAAVGLAETHKPRRRTPPEKEESLAVLLTSPLSPGQAPLVPWWKIPSLPPAHLFQPSSSQFSTPVNRNITTSQGRAEPSRSFKIP